jgi:hypothetical protein
MTPTQRGWFNAVRRSLSDDLLKPYWRRSRPSSAPKVWGHCYLATEAVYHLFGKRSGYVPTVLGLEGGGTHWWLTHRSTGAVIDPTYEQTAAGFDYSSGRHKPFFRGVGSRGESRRALELIRRARRVCRIRVRRGKV